MKSNALALVVLVTTSLIATVPLQGQQPKPGLTLSTPAFEDGGIIPPRYTTADPKPVSPKLEWTNVPAGTASYVLMLIDPDATIKGASGDVLHYMIINIPGTATSLAEDLPATLELPDGSIQPKNLGGRSGYQGPGRAAPPYHHYTWKLFALDRKLDLGGDATQAQVLAAMDGHVLERAVVMGRFHK